MTRDTGLGRAAWHPFFAQTTLSRGRVELRQLHAFAIEATSVDFAFARSIVVIRSEITWKKTGRTTAETRYYLSNAEPGEHTAEQWQTLVRGHWAGVEIRNHWRRDALWGEDRSRTRNAHALANLALLRNALRPCCRIILARPRSSTSTSNSTPAPPPPCASFARHEPKTKDHAVEGHGLALTRVRQFAEHFC